MKNTSKQYRLDGSTLEEARFDDEPKITEVEGRVLLGNRMVGDLAVFRDKRALVSYRRTKQHYFRNFDGWGISEKLLFWLQKNQVFYVLLVIDADTQRLARVSDWIAKGRKYKHPLFERQLILGDEEFEAT